MHFGGMTVVNTNLVILGMWGAHACGGSACIHSWGGDDLWVSETPKIHLRHGRPVRELWMST